MFVSEKKLAANRRNAQLAGRPVGSVESHTLEAREAKRLIVRFVVERLEPILMSLFKESQNGNIQASQELLNRGFGKPAQAVEITGEGGAPIVFMPLELIQKHALTVIDVDPQETAKNIEAPKDHDSSKSQ